MAKSLRLVDPPEIDPPVDITLLNRADIEKRDWSAVHCSKGEPLLNWQRTRRPWRA